jgi:Holliday junction resolvase RusA-like endonuclease
MVVKGHARPKGSWTPFYTRGGLRLRPASKHTKPWETEVHKQVKKQWGGPLLDGPIRVDLIFYLPKPKTAVRDFPTGKFDGDGDKLERCVWDAMTGVVYIDDRQVIEWSGKKRYAKTTPRVSITISDYEE